ncbi:hypothetical protein ANN_26288 [Periplaneta americana]|uniref:Uncharacterized protein n=1 Tax=Periplaneta americana TaxID=6978 RepID=A0ABQ8S5H7_PERAM|nr:hypothetical protein ANN_26288 [Periplaneta americana]
MKSLKILFPGLQTVEPTTSKEQVKSNPAQKLCLKTNPADADIVDRNVRNRPAAPQTLQELGDALKEEWENVPKEKIQNLIRSMPQRCKRYHCFETVYEEDRDALFHNFYTLESKDLQDSCLSEMISVREMKQRCSRKHNINPSAAESTTFAYRGSLFYKAGSTVNLKTPGRRRSQITSFRAMLIINGHQGHVT